MKAISTKAAIVSDLHLGVGQNGEKWLKESKKFALWFKDELLNKGITDVIIAGDLFHDRTDINLLTLQYTAEILDIWKSFDIWMIPGNHDCYYKENASISSINILKGYKNIKIFDKTEVIDADNKKLCFVPWGVEIKDIPKCDIIIGHFELNGFKMNSFKICEHGENCENILTKAPLVITGHFHLRQERRGKDGTILYVGSPYQMDYNDLGSDKGYHIINFANNQITFELYTKTTKHKRVLLTDLVENKDRLNDFLNEEIKGNVIILDINKEVDLDKVNALTQRILSFEPLAFRGTEYTYNKPVDTVVQLDIIKNLEIEELINEFVKQMDLEYSDDILKFILELYTKYKTI
jgi:DNA repair exonuclease SbcCD nuclease subunit